MLTNLYIKNLALIDLQEITFTRGLNILTGETGAGKSVVIGSINLALGEQGGASYIREGADYALITLTFTDLPAAVCDAIRAMDLPVEADGSVILERRIMPSRSTCKVCGETVSLKQMRALAQILIQIHGQNDHQSLLQKKEQARILDDYAGAAIKAPLEETARAYEAYEAACARVKATEIDEATRKREADLAAYELKEITDAAITMGEDEALEARFTRMSHAEKIAEALQSAARLTASSMDGESASDMVGRALKELQSVQAYDEEVAQIAAQLADADAILQDVSRAVTLTTENNAFDASAFQEVTERLNLINHLKSKYGGSVAAVHAYAEKKEEELQRLQDLDAERALALKERDKAHEVLLAASQMLHEIRAEHATRLSAQMREVLLDLNFLDNGFEVLIESDEAHLSPLGYDDVTFLISLNPGEPLKPLHEIASGGELSRIMLALKSVMADEGMTETMIFDEIDAGISGVTAWKVAERLNALSTGRQVICITHLAQIAAMQDTHYLIDKAVREEEGRKRTFTAIRGIGEEESLTELARLLGGMTEENAALTSLDNARSLRQEALRLKARN